MHIHHFQLLTCKPLVVVCNSWLEGQSSSFSLQLSFTRMHAHTHTHKGGGGERMPACGEGKAWVLLPLTTVQESQILGMRILVLSACFCFHTLNSPLLHIPEHSSLPCCVHELTSAPFITGLKWRVWGSCYTRKKIARTKVQFPLMEDNVASGTYPPCLHWSWIMSPKCYSLETVDPQQQQRGGIVCWGGEEINKNHPRSFLWYKQPLDWTHSNVCNVLSQFKTCSSNTWNSTGQDLNMSVLLAI